MQTLICKRCGYGSDPKSPWIPRVEHPKCCPSCKNRKWDEDREALEPK